MSPKAAKYLWDALTAIERIQRFIQDRAFDDYLRDDLLKSAVERQLEIVGEALGQLRKSDPEIAAQIADLPRVVAFRNVLIHGYASVDDVLVWGVVTDRLGALAQCLRDLLPS